MKTILFVYPPFCSPVSPPYALTYLVNFIKQNTEEKDFSLPLLDLNAWVHKQKFTDLYGQVNTALQENDSETYNTVAHELNVAVQNFSKEENTKLREEEENDVIEPCLQKILSYKPDKVSLSLVYNSQAFFSLQLAKKLQEQGIEVIIGGPAVTSQLMKITTHLPHEVALLEHLTKKTYDMNDLHCKRILDYSSFPKEDYAIPELIIPLRTSSCCYYQKCTFCTHHMQGNYQEYDLEDIKESIIRSQAKLVFFVDDMIHKQRLLDMAKILKPLNIKWMCQLSPTKQLDKKTLQTLHDSGLEVVIWGFESGSDRILALMKKPTNVEDMSTLIQNSAEVGITNALYTMFGFPTETKEEFLETIQFLKDHEPYISLISTSVFGLQETAPILKEPQKYSITKIMRTKRKALPEKITYEVSEGLHANDAKILRKKYTKTLNKINKYSKEMNMYREHLLYAVVNKKSL